MPYFSAVLMFSLGLYGLSFEFNDLHRHFGANLIVSLALQFMTAFTSTAMFNINYTMLIDCFPGRPASATALNNLYRCLLEAAGVSVIQPPISAVKIMKAFLIVTRLLFLFIHTSYMGPVEVRRKVEKRGDGRTAKASESG